MRKNFGKKPWLYPMPVLIVSAYDGETPAAMAVGWGGILDPQRVSMCVMDFHRTTRAIRETGAFTVGIGDYAHIKACDYVGTVSGNDVPDKVARAPFHAVPSEFVHAPILEELPLTLECTLESYDPETGTLVGRIVNVSADESVLNSAGRVDTDKFEALAYDPVKNAYRRLGKLDGGATELCNPLK